MLTSPDVPTARSRSHVRAAVVAVRMASTARDSPNSTTSGRRPAPHSGHCGTSWYAVVSGSAR
ncbi:MAG: hypothetical protein U0S36_12875 [Candidatus Nanopelagicales bacterium]